MIARTRLLAALLTLEDQARSACVSDTASPDPPPDTDGAGAARTLRRLAWLGEGVPTPNPGLAAALDTLSAASGRPAAQLEAALSAHARDVCQDEPLCQACVVSDGCARYRSRPPRRRVSADGRPRERLLRRGAGDLPDADLLALVIGSGTRGHSAVDLANVLLARFGPLARLATRTPAEIATVRGLGPAKAAALLAALETGRRLQERPLVPGARFTSSRDLVAHYGPRLRDRKRETFLALLLDGKNRVIREVRVSEGSLTASIVHPREVFNPAIRESAAAVVFVHNHPSGDPAPSRQDLEVTRRLVQTGEVVGIRVLDHVILGSEGHVSFADSGLLHSG